MTPPKKYLLDANIFIEAQHRYYPMDVVPGFWDALLEHHENKRVFSIDKIKDEIANHANDLSRWATKTAPPSLFKGTADKKVVDCFGKLMEWVEKQAQLTDAAKEQFANCADGWLIAYAKINGLVVVTHEESRRGAKKASRSLTFAMRSMSSRQTLSKCCVSLEFSWFVAVPRNEAATDRQIDALVYELYGLSDEEIQIVEEA